MEKQVFQYVALGDSLTEGVGDLSNQGGFVPLLAQDLSNQFGYDMSLANFGVSGNTSNQILKRMQKDATIGQHLAKADLMTLTVGGNDLRKTLLANLSNLSINSFDKPVKEYSKRLREIIQLARKDNPNLPIYVLGIYNPFYLHFPELTDMQLVVDRWNQQTEETLSEFDNVYFVPINDLLYKGLELEGQASGEIENNLLAEEDHFHPNSRGYEVMKQAVMEKISETKDKWKKK